MKTTCEMMVQKILPALRATITRVMFLEYGYTQQQIAEILNVSRAAVSQYMSEKRGAEVIFPDEILSKVQEFSTELVTGLDQKQQVDGICHICRFIQRSQWFYDNVSEAGSFITCESKQFN